MSLLQIKDLSVLFHTENGSYKAIESINFNLQQGKTLALVGESGCGKSVTSLAIMKLLPEIAEIQGGDIIFNGENIALYKQKAMQKIRGNEIAMIFQEPLTALNPVFTVGQQISESLRIHKQLSRIEAQELSYEMLEKVKLPEPKKNYNKYPFQLSGGMKQRILIAMALSCSPKLLIADEPTTALDVTIQAQILELIKDLQEEMNMAVIFITHDLGVVAQVADDVAIMYSGRIIEQGTVYDIFDRAKHPYTKGLLTSIPQVTLSKKKRLTTIKGIVPNIYNRPKGCQFHNRCDYIKDFCTKEPPQAEDISNSHLVACYRHKELSNATSTEG